MINPKNKGFTMVELLAVIVIISILSTIGIASLTRIRKSQADKFDKTQMDIITQAAITYFTDNKTNLPVSLCTEESVTLKELQDKKYIDEVLDYYKKPYKPDSYVTVIKSISGYEYEPHINTEGRGVVSIEAKKSDVTISSTISNYTNKKDGTYYTNKDYMLVKLNMTSAKSGVCSYKYTITGKNADGKRINYTSENISLSEHYNEETGVSEEIKLNYSAYKDGNYKLTAMVRDGKGYETRKTVNIILDKTPPTCTISTSGTKSKNEWYTSNATITLKVSDKTAKVSGMDLTKSETSTYKELPEELIIEKTQKNTHYDGQNWYGYAKDYAGNTKSCKKNVKVDTVKPVIQTVQKEKGETGELISLNGWSNKDIIVKTTGKDDNSSASSSMYYSGIGTWYYSYNKYDAEWNNHNKWNEYKNTSGAVITIANDAGASNSNLVTTPYTIERNQEVYIYLCDNAGNCTRYNEDEKKDDIMIKLDKTNPTCKIGVSGTKGENSWYTTTASISLKKEDEGLAPSGVKYYGLTTGSESYNSKTSNTQSDTSSTTWNGYVKDTAGNTNSCSKNVKVDTVKPVIGNISVTSNGVGFNSSSVKVGVSVTDKNNANYSIGNSAISTDISYKDLKYAKSTTSVDWDLNASYDGGKKTVYVTAKDEAGNFATTSNSNYAIYKKCSSSYISNSSDGACSAVCGAGQYTHTDYYSDSYLGVSCDSKNKTLDCNVPYDYKDGSDCSAECGGGTYNREAYAVSSGLRCPQFDETEGGSACNTKACPSKTKITIKNKNYWVCPCDEEVGQDRKEACAKHKLYNRIHIYDAKADETKKTVTFKLDIWMNDFASSWQGGSTLSICLTKEGSSKCNKKIKSFKQTEGWLKRGEKKTFTETVDVSKLSGSYRLTLINNISDKFQFLKGNSTIFVIIEQK